MAREGESARDQILHDFQRLVAQRQERSSRIVTREEAAARERNIELVEAALALTAERIVKDSADLQLTFDRAIGELASTLLTEAAKLEQIRRAIAIERERLEELGQIEIAANALDILAREQQEQAQTFAQRCSQQREGSAQETAAQREAWRIEQHEHEREVAAYNQALRAERELAEADYAYELARKRRVEADDFAANRRRKELEISELEREKIKQWAERERTIAARAGEIDEYRTQIDAFPQELEKASQEARNAATQEAEEHARVRAELLEKESAVNEQIRELQLQALHETIARQAVQTEALAHELTEALARAQELASKAIGGSAAAQPNPGQQVGR